MATASSTAAPKLMASPKSAAGGAPEPKITQHSTSVSRNSAAMESLLSHPRFVTPTRIQSRISPPITRHQTQCPAGNTLPAAKAPS